MAQKLDVIALANALAIITAVSYIICAVLLWVSPEFATTLFNYLIHDIDITSIVVVRSFSYTILSLILGTITAWVFGALFAIVYNKLAK